LVAVGAAGLLGLTGQANAQEKQSFTPSEPAQVEARPPHLDNEKYSYDTVRQAERRLGELVNQGGNVRFNATYDILWTPEHMKSDTFRRVTSVPLVAKVRGQERYFGVKTIKKAGTSSLFKVNAIPEDNLRAQSSRSIIMVPPTAEDPYPHWEKRDIVTNKGPIMVTEAGRPQVEIKYIDGAQELVRAGATKHVSIRDLVF
jgi:hypothetical protein